MKVLTKEFNRELELDRLELQTKEKGENTVFVLDYIESKNPEACEVYEQSIENSNKAVAGLSIEKQLAEHEYFENMQEVLFEATITKLTKNGSNIFIELDGEVSLMLTGAETLEEEINPDNTEIRMFELHNYKEYYELHLLLAEDYDKLFDYYATYKFNDMRLIK